MGIHCQGGDTCKGGILVKGGGVLVKVGIHCQLRGILVKGEYL